jgi:CRISPR type IV-associated protein Csf3
MELLNTEGATPLRVEFELRHGSPIREPGHIIHLDALMAFAAVQRSLLAGSENYSAQEQLPLSKITDGKESDPVWAASGLFYQPYLKEVRYWSRKTNIEKIAQDKDRGLLVHRGDSIETGSGPWKGYSDFEPLLHTRILTGWCVGRKDEVEDLLSDIHFVGKRRSRGYGEVTSLRVTEDPLANEKILARVLTWAASKDYVPMMCGVRPPYFEKKPGFYPKRAVFENNAQ